MPVSDEALQTAEAETPAPSADEAPAAVEETAEEIAPEAAPAPEAEAAEEAPAAEAEVTETEKAEEAVEDEVEKAGARISRKSNDAVVAAMNSMLAVLRDAGFKVTVEAEDENEDSDALTEKSDSSDATETPEAEVETQVTKSAEQTRIEELERQLAETTAELDEMRSSNSQKRPSLLVSKSDGPAEKTLDEQLAEIKDPSERLRFAFRHRGN
jgi:hypothetical protein